MDLEDFEQLEIYSNVSSKLRDEKEILIYSRISVSRSSIRISQRSENMVKAKTHILNH